MNLFFNISVVNKLFAFSYLTVHIKCLYSIFVFAFTLFSFVIFCCLLNPLTYVRFCPGLSSLLGPTGKNCRIVEQLSLSLSCFVLVFFSRKSLALPGQSVNTHTHIHRHSGTQNKAGLSDSS